MLEKPCIKIIDFDTFVFFTTESKSITFNTGLFLEDLFSLRRKSQIWIIVFPEGCALAVEEKTVRIFTMYLLLSHYTA